MVKAHVTTSADGFMAGPDQTEEHPLGTGGERLHRWMFEGGDPDKSASDREQSTQAFTDRTGPGTDPREIPRLLDDLTALGASAPSGTVLGFRFPDTASTQR